jgi:hypothetical protein
MKGHKKSNSVKKLRKWLKKEINSDKKKGSEIECAKLKLTQIVDGEAQIFYIVDDELLVIQINDLLNCSENILIDFNVCVILSKYGKIHKSLKGPKFNIDAQTTHVYNKEFVFHLLFDDLPSTCVIIQVYGILNDKQIVTSRVLIQLSNFDIIYSSMKMLQEISNQNNVLMILEKAAKK